MRLLGTLFASLIVLCLLCAPASAQSSSPSASQYEPGTCPSGTPDSYCAQSLADGADDFADNAERGTDTVNDALGAASSAAASVVPGDASAPRGSASPTRDPASSDTEGPGGITKLPETGGASLAALGFGLLLVTLGFMTRRLAGR